MRTVAIIDYGAGNLRSVGNALRAIGADVTLARTPEQVSARDAVILPGVGAFPHVRAKLDESGLAPAFMDAVASGKPALGICVGMQMLFENSEEFETTPGFALVAGAVRKIDVDTQRARLPHIGWRTVEAYAAASGSMFDGLPPNERRFYFVHSFTAGGTSPAATAATTTYGGSPIVAAVRRENLWGVQFHPEKSAAAGLRLLQNFLAQPG